MCKRKNKIQDLIKKFYGLFEQSPQRRKSAQQVTNGLTYKKQILLTESLIRLLYGHWEHGAFTFALGMKNFALFDT